VSEFQTQEGRMVRWGAGIEWNDRILWFRDERLLDRMTLFCISLSYNTDCTK